MNSAYSLNSALRKSAISLNCESKNDILFPNFARLKNAKPLNHAFPKVELPNTLTPKDLKT